MRHCIFYSSLGIVLCVFICLLNFAQAQTANATTDPSEGQ